MLCIIHCGIHTPKCVVHCGIHPPKCAIHCGVHIPNSGDLICQGCKTNPYWSLGVDALNKAKDQGLISSSDWQGLLNSTIYTVAEVNILAGLIAAACGDCLTKEVFKN